MTTGEGGVITTEGFESAYQMRRFRNHGITSDHFERAQQGSWLYEMVELGYNYRLNDFQCALGTSQLTRLPRWLERRRAIASLYDTALAELPGVMPQRVCSDVQHAYHLYVIRLDCSSFESRIGHGFSPRCAPKASALMSTICPSICILTTANASAPVPGFAPRQKRRTRRFCRCPFFQAWTMRMSMTLSRLFGRS